MQTPQKRHPSLEGAPYDVIYWWGGGNMERDYWHEAVWNVYPEYKSAQETIDGIRRMGYVAWFGKRSIGAPEGEPSKEDFASVGMV